MASTGVAVLDFGPWPGSPHAQVVIRGQAGITANSDVTAFIRAQDATAEHSVDEHIIERIRLSFGSVVPGVGFTITGECLNGRAYGRFVVTWIWQNPTVNAVTLSQVTNAATRGRSGAAAVVSAVWTPASLPGVFAWYRADSVVLNATKVSQWTDLTGNGRHLTQASAVIQPTWNASDLHFNNKPSMTFGLGGTSAQLNAATASDWKFLHDGTGMTVIEVGYCTDPFGQNNISWATTDGGAGNVGAMMDWIGNPATGLAITAPYNSSTSSPMTTGYGTVNTNVPKVLITKMKAGQSPEQVILNENGVAIQSRSIGITPSTADPSAPLRVGLSTNGSSRFTGELVELVFVAGYLTDYEVSLVVAYLQERYISTWTPAQLPGLTAWYRGDTVTLNGSAVSSWTDKSGNTRHLLQASAPSQPLWVPTEARLNGQPVLDFDGTNDGMNTASSLANFFSASTGTVFAVFAADAVDTSAADSVCLSNDPIWTDTLGVTGVFLSSAGPKVQTFANIGGNVGTSSPFALGATTSVIQRRASGNIHLKVNSATEVTIAGGNLANMAGGFQIGASFAQFNGRIAEIAVSQNDEAASYADWLAYVYTRYGNAGWTPASLPGLTCWLRSDDVTLGAGNIVTQWNDKSGNNRHFTQSVATTHPLWGPTDSSFKYHPSVVFDGINDTVTGPVLSDLMTASEGEILLVGKYNDDVNFDCLVLAYNPPATSYVAAIRRAVAGAVTSGSNDGTQDQTPGISLTTAAIKGEWRHQGGTLYCKVGATETSIASGDISATVFNNPVGLANVSGGTFAACSLVEVVFTTTALSAADRASWDAYVLARYGIS